MEKKEKKESKLDQRSENFSCIINQPNEEGETPPLILTTQYIYDKLISEFRFIALIEHDRDYYDNGIKKLNHWHVVISTNRTRVGTILNKVSKLINVPKKVISVETTLSLRGSIRYLMHLDHPNKAQYAIFELLTSDITVINDSLVDRQEIITPIELINIVSNAKNLTDVLLKIGLQNFNRYLRTITTIFEERNTKGYK